jgi:hypothetical protein
LDRVDAGHSTIAPIFKGLREGKKRPTRSRYWLGRACIG